MTPFPQDPTVTTEGPGEREPAQGASVVQGRGLSEGAGGLAGGGRTDGAAAMAPVPREAIADLAKAATSGGRACATLPAVAVLIQDAESASVLPAKRLAVTGRRTSWGQWHLGMDLSPSLKPEPKPSPPAHL